MIDLILGMALAWVIGSSLVISIILEIFKLQTIISRITLLSCVLILAHSLSLILH